MNGNEAAAIVGELCKQKQHRASSGNPKAFLVCQDCHDVMEALRAKHRDDNPLQPTVSAHFVLDQYGMLDTTTFDEAEATNQAIEVKGVVVSWPVAADYRKTGAT